MVNASQVLAARVDECLSTSQVLAARVDDCLSTSQVVGRCVTSSLLADPHIAAKSYPYQADRLSLVLARSDANDGDPGRSLPVPPMDLWEGYGETADEYLDTGRKDAEMIRRLTEAAGFSLSPAVRLLDFGCAAGRILRWFKDICSACELWGADIRADSMLWCQENLSPPFHFVTTTTFPHLPFEDRYFDLIYTGSVFTHIPDHADTWLLELRRVLRPGGFLLNTIHDEHTIDILRDPDRCRRHGAEYLRDMLASAEKDVTLDLSKYGMLVTSREPRVAQVFHHIDYIRKHWGQFFNIVSVTQEAYGYQTAVLLKKPV
jgi:ubiquinone/menaquinone biosynthesis C-methylase UbiE